jgi:hypothetical protein
MIPDTEKCLKFIRGKESDISLLKARNRRQQRREALLLFYSLYSKLNIC